MENTNTIDGLITHAEEYLKTRQQLTQHVVTEKVIVLSASMITSYVVFMFFALATFFASWGLAQLISITLNDALAGYWLVAGGYAFLGFLLHLTRNRILKTPLMNSMVRTIYNSRNEQNN